MIRFDEVKKSEGEICFFFARKWRKEMEYCLKECGIVYEIVDQPEMEKRFPKTKVPETVPFSDKLKNETSNMCILVTNLNTKGLAKKYKELMACEDPDVRAFRKARSLAGLREYEEMEQMRREDKMQKTDFSLFKNVEFSTFFLIWS